MESLPTLQNFHLSLCNENGSAAAADAEEELLSVVSHLLVCAIEDPGIPNPVRHTTLLGQSLRSADITNGNISEILRIYLYAVATGEVRTLSGITLDRDRERRIADHHATEDLSTSSSKNHLYYELLHENTTWKLSECLKQNPFVSLNPTVKTQILAHICNDLLLNKAVVKQIEGSLEAMAQYKREKYLLENRIRKYKHLHTRKLRMEQFERAQMLARQQAEMAPTTTAAGFVEPGRLVAAATTPSDAAMVENNNEGDKPTTTTTPTDTGGTTMLKTTSNLSVDNLSTDGTTSEMPKEDSMHSTDVVIGGGQKQIEASPMKESDDKMVVDDFVPVAPIVAPPPPLLAAPPQQQRPLNNGGTTTPDMTSLLNKKIINRNSVGPTDGHDISVNDVTLDDDSDLESEGTIMEEDEDNRMTSEEVFRKLEKILKSGQQNKMLLEQSCNQLRATCHGQDRYWRRYWHLPKTGGIFVEALESAQPEILKYHGIDDERLKLEAERKMLEDSKVPPPTPPITDDLTDVTEPGSRKRKRTECDDDAEDNADNVYGDANKTENETNDWPAQEAVASQVTTQTPPKLSMALAPAPPPPPPPPPPVEDDGMMDIEDSIPRAILMQNKNKNDETIVEVNNQIGGVNVNMLGQKTPDKTMTAAEESPQVIDDDTNDAIDGTQPTKDNDDVKPLLENGESKTTESPLDQKPTADALACVAASAADASETKDDPVPTIKEENIKEENIKIEIKDEAADSSNDIKKEPLFDKWFSIANREMPLTSAEYATSDISLISNANVTCEAAIPSQGNPWDITNNAHYFMVPIADGPGSLQFPRVSHLTPSGLEESMMEREKTAALKRRRPNDDDEENDAAEVEEDVDRLVPVLDLARFEEQPLQLNAYHIPTLLNMSLVNISAYMQCDNPSPLQMTLDEAKQMEEVKLNGMPKRLQRNLVTANLRHGWWKIEDMETINEMIQCLHVRGVRERELRLNLLNALGETIDMTTHCPIADPAAGCEPRGYYDPEPMNAWNPEIARRVELNLLDQVESLEDKIASASMQVKGWVVPSKDGEPACPDDVDAIVLTRERILGLEAAIERRYLKPPLGTRYSLLFSVLTVLLNFCVFFSHTARPMLTLQQLPRIKIKLVIRRRERRNEVNEVRLLRWQRLLRQQQPLLLQLLRLQQLRHQRRLLQAKREPQMNLR